MSMPWAPLLPIAMVGTARAGDRLSALSEPSEQPRSSGRSGPAGRPDWPGDIGTTIAAAVTASDEPALGLLRAAGIVAACTLAGRHGEPLETALPRAAGEDGLPAVAAGPLRSALRKALDEGMPRLHHEAFAVLGRAGLRLPDAMLPQALDLGRRFAALRPALAGVLGERGRWLAGQREEWAYAAGDPVDAGRTGEGCTDGGHADEGRTTERTDGGAPWGHAWEYGSIDQRCAVLVRERGRDPGAARERLQQALPTLPAAERARLTAALATGLSTDDEALLDRLRADRSQDTREAALALLLRLPRSSYAIRAGERLRALLRPMTTACAPAGPGTQPGAPTAWTIDAPATADPAWPGDQIDPVRPPRDALGERAWWLYQLVRRVPFHWWQARTGMAPAALFAWAARTDWRAALLRGWRDVLFACPEPDACDAMLAHGAQAFGETPAAVLGLLPPARREPHLRRRLEDPAEDPGRALVDLLAATPVDETLGAAISVRVTERILAAASAAPPDGGAGLRPLLPELAAAIHLDALDALAGLAPGPDAGPAAAECLHRVARIIAIRRAWRTPPRPVAVNES